MAVEQVPDIPMLRQNTAAFGHELDPGSLSDLDGADDHVRVQVLTNGGVLDRDKQLAVVAKLTALVVEAAGNPGLKERTWVLLTEPPDGGWGLWGHASTNADLVQAARDQVSTISTGR
jgi:phenylpyruvate tautomerase PptA (4-oxalocrotonate tautomerase family)